MFESTYMGSHKAGVTLLFATKEMRYTQRCFLTKPYQTKPKLQRLSSFVHGCKKTSVTPAILLPLYGLGLSVVTE